ncbi:MAG: radical SAM protein [Polyangiaceae bacterium]|jgi:radical SAM protein with 4Fe4S-binding SPASM domain
MGCEIQASVARREALWETHNANWDKLVREHELRYLFLEVTRRCNLACAYCGSGCSPKASRGEMPISTWIETVRQVAADFDTKRIMVAVTGGEPLIKDGIDDLFFELGRLGFGFGMVTNGQLLDAPWARRIVGSGMGSLSVSMDGPAEFNDRLRGKGVSAKVEQAIDALRTAGFSGKLEIISTITKPVVPILAEIRASVAALRVPYWRVAPVMPIGRAAQRPDLLPDPADIRAILEFVRAARRDGQEPSPEFSEEGFVGNRFEGCVRPYLCQCRAGISVAGILSDGRIGACPELGDAFVQGAIHQSRLKDVWNTRYEVFRDRSWTRKGVCGDCAQYDRCHGGSLHLYASPDAELARCLYRMAKSTEERPRKEA